MRCDGVCGRELDPNEPVVEVERINIFCMGCALITTPSMVQDNNEHDRILQSLEA